MRGQFHRRVIHTLAMVLVALSSLLLLNFVASEDAQRTYREFNLEKLLAQGRVIQNAMESFLRAGLPLKQYVGLSRRAEKILISDDTIAAIAVFDASGRRVFSSGIDDVPLLPLESALEKGPDGSFELRQSDGYFQVVLPLNDRFENVGSLALTMPVSVITERAEEGFIPLRALAVGLSIAFGVFVSVAGRRLTGRRTQVAYGLTFLIMAAFVVSTLITLYSDGVRAKTKALADALGQRVSDIAAFNLNVDEVVGLDQTFIEYRRLNPDIAAVGLIVDGKVRVHTEQRAIGSPWVRSNNTYEYTFHLTPPHDPRPTMLAVAVPTEIVFRQIARNVKNFGALFVATAFLAGLFFQLASSMQQSGRETDESNAVPHRVVNNEAALSVVKPIFFVAVFIEHLNHPFLPQFAQQIATDAELSANYASAPFMLFYLLFALALIPAGRFSQKVGPKPLMYTGLILSAIGLLTLAVPVDFTVFSIARGVSGAGQGILFIGVQSYILAVAPPQKKTQGAAIIVFGFQGGMISGTAIGSLIVVHIGPEGVFMLAGVIAVIMAVFAKILAPVVAFSAQQTQANIGMTARQISGDVRQVLRSLYFLKAIILVGAPAKAIMTGVIVFALPLLLSQAGFAQEDIGQVIMLYAAGVLAASIYASRRVDRTERTDTVLFRGTLISGLGLLLIGLVDWEPIVRLSFGLSASSLVVVTGVLIVGLAHGFINAPVVTHIAGSDVASKIGPGPATATYRFLERVGHVAGPIIVAQLFFFFDAQGAMVIAWMGGAIAIMGLLFLVPVESSSTPHSGQVREPVPAPPVPRVVGVEPATAPASSATSTESLVAVGGTPPRTSQSPDNPEHIR